MTEGRRVCLELFVIFFTSRNVQCCYGFLLLQSYHQLALSPIHVLWCYDTFQSYTLMHFNLLRLHIFFLQRKKYQSFRSRQRKQLKCYGCKIVRVAIMWNLAVNSLFKQNDEQLRQKGKFDSAIKLSIVAIPTTFANFSFSPSLNSAQGKWKM